MLSHWTHGRQLPFHYCFIASLRKLWFKLEFDHLLPEHPKDLQTFNYRNSMKMMSDFLVLQRSIVQRNTDKHGFSWENLSMKLQINTQNKYDHREVCLKQNFLGILFSRFGTLQEKIKLTHTPSTQPRLSNSFNSLQCLSLWDLSK